MNSNKIRLSSLISTIIIVLLAIVNLTPILTRSLNPIVSVSLFVLWLAVAIITWGVNGVLNDRNKVALWWGILIGWQIFLAFIGYSSTFLNVFIHRISIYLIPVIGVCVINHYNKNEQNLLFSLLLVVLSYNLIDNIILGRVGHIFDEYAAWESEYVNSNAGKTTFVSTMMYLSSLMLVVFLSVAKNRLLVKLISLTLTILSSYYVVFINSRATATLLLFVLFVGLLYFHNNRIQKRVRPFLRFWGVMIVLLLFLIPFWDTIISLLPERSANRFVSIQEAVGSGQYGGYESDESFSTRLALAGISLRTWLSGPFSFLFGIGEDAAHDGSFYDLMKLGIGQHSEFLDFLAMYGVFGAFILYRALKAVYKTIMSVCNDIRVQYKVEVILMVFFIGSFLNNSLRAGEMFLLTVMLPILIILLRRNSRSVTTA